MMTPKISIIIPTYNAEKYIEETVKSILNQTYTNFECLFINDGSSDRTLQSLESIKDPRIIIKTIPNHGGPSKPRNIGLNIARGDYIFMFDSDDLMDPTKLAECIHIFETTKADFIFTDFKCINEDGVTIKNSFLEHYQNFRYLLKNTQGNSGFLTPEAVPNEIVKANFIGTSSVAFKTSKIKRHALFNESLLSGDDKLAWVTLSKSLNFYFLNKTLHSYRVTNSSISNTHVNRLLTNKISVLNLIISTHASDLTLLQDCQLKRAEYFFGLGYFHVTQKHYRTARQYYWQAMNDKTTIKTLLAIIKSYMFQLFRC